MNLETKEWEDVGSLTSGRIGHYSWISQGKIMIAGGSSTKGGLPQDSIEIFDPESKTWSVSGKYFF